MTFVVRSLRSNFSAEPGADLQGSLAMISAPDLLQFVSMSARTGELSLVREPDKCEARVYYQNGEVPHVVARDKEGLDALAEIIGWTDGRFHFSPGVRPTRKSVDLPLQHAIMLAAERKDEDSKDELTVNPPRRNKDMAPTPVTVRTSTEVLEDLLKVPGITAVLVVGRDGFVIESAGRSASVELDGLGASLAHAVNGIEEMGKDLSIGLFQDLFVEYGRSVILCRPVGDSVVALVTPDASKLGIIRHKIKGLVDELVHVL